MHRKVIPAYAISLLLLLVTVAGARAKGVPDLSAEELKARMEQPRRILVVDTRTSQEYRQGHITRAINIPPEQFEQLPTLLPANKNVPLVFYCRGFD